MDGSNSSRNETSGETENEALLSAIDTGIEVIRTQLITKGLEKGSLSDLVRLLQLRKELEGSRPRRISARWIDECKTSTD